MSITYRNIYFDDPWPDPYGESYVGKESGDYFDGLARPEAACRARGGMLPGEFSDCCGTFRRVEKLFNGVPFVPPVGLRREKQCE